MKLLLGDLPEGETMDHDTVVNDWQQNAQLRGEENYQFLRSMKFRNYGFRPDKLAAEPQRPTV